MILNNKIPKLAFLIQKINYLVHYEKRTMFIASPSIVFDVVKNTQKYSQFIPWCSNSTIKKVISNQQNWTQLTISFKKVKQLSYLSHVKISGQDNNDKIYKIKSVCEDYPLKSLVSIWQIEKQSIKEGQIEMTNVNYLIDYQFSSPLMQLTSNLFLNYVGESMALIFKEECQKQQRNFNSKSNSITNKNQSSSKLVFEKQNQNTVQVKQIKEKKSLSVRNLEQYLQKNKNIKQMCNKNNQFKQKLQQWSKMLEGTTHFEEKIQFNIKNYLIYKG